MRVEPEGGPKVRSGSAPGRGTRNRGMGEIAGWGRAADDPDGCATESVGRRRVAAGSSRWQQPQSRAGRAVYPVTCGNSLIVHALARLPKTRKG